METIGIYLLKMFICSAVLYGYYRAALYNERFHHWNRFYLLVAMVLSVVVPFLNIPIFTEQPMVVTAVAAMPWNMDIVVKPTTNSFTWQSVALTAGLAITAVLLVRILVSVVKLLIAYRKNPVTPINEKVQLIVTELNNAPFSFFNWLFWRQDIDPESSNGQRMLAHELTHIREKHSYDKLFTELLLCVFWVNPFFWLMRKELEMIHEFLADRKAIEKQDGRAFAEMILQAIHVQPQYAMTNPFFSSQIKRRLLMITTNKQSNYTYARRIAGLLIIPVVVLAVSCSRKNDTVIKEEKTNSVTAKTLAASLILLDGKPISDAEMKQIPTDSILSMNILKGADAVAAYGQQGINGVIVINTKKTLQEVQIENDLVFSKTENPATFPGGKEGWRSYLSQVLNYPEKAQENGTQGVAKVKFIVDTDGNLSDLQIVQDPGDGLGEEAKRLIAKGPKWKPALQNGKIVKSEVTQTITFQLQ